MGAKKKLRSLGFKDLHRLSHLFPVDPLMIASQSVVIYGTHKEVNVSYIHSLPVPKHFLQNVLFSMVINYMTLICRYLILLSSFTTYDIWLLTFSLVFGHLSLFDHSRVGPMVKELSLFRQINDGHRNSIFCSWLF